jgi:hypothetical protein
LRFHYAASVKYNSNDKLNKIESLITMSIYLSLRGMKQSNPLINLVF